MKPLRHVPLLSLFVIAVLLTGITNGRADDKPFEPVSGQAGKDVVWVPTPPVLVEKMLDLAGVTKQDYVIDLGSGDGRNVIAAAKRGARALGVEYNPKMVALSQRAAAAAGVADSALFVEGDMFAADISEATVLALFLLPENLERLKPKFLDLKPGTRIVLNTFGINQWDPDRTESAGDGCTPWCQALLYIVPAKVAGRWTMSGGEMKLEQQFQKISGSIARANGAVTLSEPSLQGDRIRFSAGGVTYTGRVSGHIMGGESSDPRIGRWVARRIGD